MSDIDNSILGRASQSTEKRKEKKKKNAHSRSSGRSTRGCGPQRPQGSAQMLPLTPGPVISTNGVADCAQKGVPAYLLLAMEGNARLIDEDCRVVSSRTCDEDELSYGACLMMSWNGERWARAVSLTTYHGIWSGLVMSGRVRSFIPLSPKKTAPFSSCLIVCATCRLAVSLISPAQAGDASQEVCRGLPG